jgi:hypothetical protein
MPLPQSVSWKRCNGSAIAGRIFNVSGFLGTHHSRGLDRNFVRIYAERGGEWLVGDERPATTTYGCLMLIVLGDLAGFERELIRTR